MFKTSIFSPSISAKSSPYDLDNYEPETILERCRLIQVTVEHCLDVLGFSGYNISCACYERQSKTAAFIIELQLCNEIQVVAASAKSIEENVSVVLSSQYPGIRFRLVWSFRNFQGEKQLSPASKITAWIRP